MKEPIITLLSDFGTVDGFVGAMKGVILSLAPGARIIDLSHDIPAQDIRGGAWALREAAPLFPVGTIHVTVVDPGVGTERRPLLLESGGQSFIGPDNGVLTLAAREDCRAWSLEDAQYFRPQVSATFHGRDIFAPVAGHLAAGKDPSVFGPEIERWRRLPLPEPVVGQSKIEGQVIHVDRFGNLITNIPSGTLTGETAWRVNWREVDIGPIRRTFGDVASGAWVAYPGSSGMLELGIRDGRAASKHQEQDLYAVVSVCAGD